MEAMKKHLILDEIGVFALSLFMYHQLPYSWWLFLALILIPDVSMLGYVVNKSVGALVYNIGHSRGLAMAIWFLGYYQGISWVMLTGVILFSHASMDRIFGYGFKYADAFKHTHLHEIPEAASPAS